MKTLKRGRYGPVIPSLYAEYKKYGSEKIDEVVSESPIKNPPLERFLDKIWGVYGGFDGLQLSDKTHEPGTPWSITWERAKNPDFPFSLKITNDLIKDYYSQKIAENKIING